MTSKPKTQKPTKVPTTAKPTFSPTSAAPSQFCFPNRNILKLAVDSYISENCATNNETCATRMQYNEIGTWCVKHVTSIYLMFFGASSFNSNISNWNVGSVIDMEDMFYRASSFNSNIANWNGSSVTTMHAMFYKASRFNSNIANWNVCSVTSMFRMFYGASSFNQNLCPWGSKLPPTFNYGNAAYMFELSSCPNKGSPTGLTGPWCANCTAWMSFPFCPMDGYVCVFMISNQSTLACVIKNVITLLCQRYNGNCHELP